MEERYRRQASDVLYEMCVKRKYFHAWNVLIHEHYMTSLAKGLSDHLDRIYTVKKWYKWTRTQQQHRLRGEQCNRFILIRNLKRWKMFTMRALSNVRAEAHWRHRAKTDAVRVLQRSAQNSIALRGKKIVADDHCIGNRLCSAFVRWMDYIREQQELRGKYNQAEEYYNIELLRKSFQRIGQPIMECKGKEMLAHQLRKMHQTRRLTVS